DNLATGKQIIDNALAGGDVKYINNFRDVTFDPPEATDASATVRYSRRVLCYRALLFKAGLQPPSSLKPDTKGPFGNGLFRQDLLAALRQPQGKDPSAYANAATILSKRSPSWAELAQAFGALRNFVSDSTSAFPAFD